MALRCRRTCCRASTFLRACGEKSHLAMRRLCALVSECMGSASHATIDGAAHFMIATHAGEVARLVAEHARRAEATDIAPGEIAKFSRENKDVLNDIHAARCHRERTRNAEPFPHNS